MTASDIKYNTDMFHVTIVFEDTFSFAITRKRTTVSGLTLRQMLVHVGEIVISRFDGQRHENLMLKSIDRLDVRVVDDTEGFIIY